MFDFFRQPWSWYVSGALIGLIVPALLILGNRQFGISATLRHLCAALIPAKIPFFHYNWRREMWNFFFVAGIAAGAWFTVHFFSNPVPPEYNQALMHEMAAYGIRDTSSMLPSEIFSWQNLVTPRSIILLIGGGFLVGFGTRYAGGCTSGHSIMGLSSLQLPSLIATICFFVGGVLTANFLMPIILRW